MDRTSVEVRVVGEEEWPELRGTRLAALKDSPDAFWSSYEREAAYDDAIWRERAAAGSTFLARTKTGEPVGIATGIAHPGARELTRELVGMWVAPQARGRGIAGQLVAAVIAWAREDGADELGLWVVDGNAAARTAYERAGFVPTGENQSFPGGDPRTESQMVLHL